MATLDPSHWALSTKRLTISSLHCTKVSPKANTLTGGFLNTVFSIPIMAFVDDDSAGSQRTF
jgi:hypothetical protein